MLNEYKTSLPTPFTTKSTWTSIHPIHSLSLIHISEPTRLALISYAVFCFKKFFFNDTATTEIYTV